MFLKLSREDFSWSRSKKAFPLFFLLWLSGLLVALLYLFSVRIHLQTIERSQTEKLLKSSLAVYQATNRLTGSRHLQQDNVLQGLAFLRIIQGDDQMLMVSEQGGEISFKGLIDLPPGSSGVWVPVGTGEDEHLLSIIVREYKNGLVIQAGKDGQDSHTLFGELVRYTIYIVLTSLLILWPLSLYFIKRSLFPLISTRNKIADLVHRSRTELLPEQGNGPELDAINRQINQIIQQNRHLVTEMQHSLDNVAHDLRTPMTRLRSVAEYGLQAEDNIERLRDALSDCLEESERVLAMLKIMMSVAEAESGTMQLELEDCDLTKTLQQVVTLYEYVAEEQKIAVVLETDRPVPARVDITRISQVWANLLDNAIKYTKKGGWVKISLQTAQGETWVRFSDNGMGISESEQERVWERLYRGDRSRSRKGLGLGLNYVQAVVTAHGGTVSVTSKLHAGSQFEICLPLGHG